MIKKALSLGSIFSIFLMFLFFSKTVEAKVLPQARGVSTKTVVKSATGTNISVYPRLRSDRRALIVNFANLQSASAVSYSLTYKQSLPPSDGKTSTQDEGAMGSLSLGGSANANTELLFGTCSKNVCRYHTGIKDAKFEVSYTTKAGKKYLKRYKIKV